MYDKHHYGLADLSGKICGVVAKRVSGLWCFWIPPGGEFGEHSQSSYISKYYAMEACEDAISDKIQYCLSRDRNYEVV